MTFDASEPASFSTAVELWSEVMDSHGEALEAKICVAHNATFAPDEEELLSECLAWCADNFVEFVRATDAELYVVGNRHCRRTCLIQFLARVHSFIHPFIRSFVICSFVHTFIHSYIHTFIHTFIHTKYIHSYVHPFVHASINSSINRFILPSIHPLIDSSVNANYWCRLIPAP
jgi:hypothetical protein